jgi:hypothetical protein
MITNAEKYERLCERERWETLRAMSVRETIAIGEALLTSELMDLAVFPDDDAPKSLAIALGLAVPRE